jgi:hypothetical protein
MHILCFILHSKRSSTRSIEFSSQGDTLWNQQLLSPVLLGLALAASTGLNTFLPLLTLSRRLTSSSSIPNRFSTATSLGLHRRPLSTALGLATTVEVIGDKIPVVDHALDTFGTFARPLVGAFATASVFSTAIPQWQRL